MLYRFQSPACGDVIMLADVAEPILQLLGRQGQRPGIIQVADLASTRQALQAAIRAEEADWDEADKRARAQKDPLPKRPSLGLRQRCHSLLQMLDRCEQAGESIVWQ